MARRAPPAGYSTRLMSLSATPAGRWLLRGLCAAVVLLAVGLVVRRARAHAYRLPCYRIDAASITFVDLHPALGPLLEDSLRDPRWLQVCVSIFDSRAEDRVRRTVARHPMVSAVQSVELRYPNRAFVRVKVREPGAWFFGDAGWVLVSTDGRRLDRRLYRHYLERLKIPLPKVVGVRSRPPDLPGQAWEDRPEQVVEGLAAARVAARLYRDFRGRLFVETIDVGRFPAPPEKRRRGEVRLILHDGTVVEWGRTERARSGVASEDGYETKRHRMETELARKRPHHRGRIDVRFRLPQEGRGFLDAGP